MNAAQESPSTQNSAAVLHARDTLKSYYSSSLDLKEGLEVVEINTDALPASWRERWDLL